MEARKGTEYLEFCDETLAAIDWIYDEAKANNSAPLKRFKESSKAP